MARRWRRIRHRGPPRLFLRFWPLPTGVPVHKITEEESSRLLTMEQELLKRVIGQEHAIAALSRAIRCTRAG